MRSAGAKKRRRKSLQLEDSIRKMGGNNNERQGFSEQINGKKERIRVEENCTVVLADISGFTALAEKLAKLPDGRGTEELSSRLNSYFGRMIDMIYEGGGDVVKFAGDALLVVWRDNTHTGKKNGPHEKRKAKLARQTTEPSKGNSGLGQDVLYPLPSLSGTSGRRKRRSMFSMTSTGQKACLKMMYSSKHLVLRVLQRVCLGQSAHHYWLGELQRRRMQRVFKILYS